MSWLNCPSPAIPSFTLTADAGYELSDLSFSIGGSLFSLGTAPSASTTLPLGLATTFTAPQGAIGEWTLGGTTTLGSYTTLDFAGGTLTLTGNQGYIFVNSTTGPKFTFSVAAAVPEAESWALALAGLGVAGLVLGRSRRQA